MSEHIEVESNEEDSQLGKRKRSDYEAESGKPLGDAFRPPKKRLKQTRARRAPTPRERIQLEILDKAAERAIAVKNAKASHQSITILPIGEEDEADMDFQARRFTAPEPTEEDQEPEEEGELGPSPELSPMSVSPDPETQENPGESQGVILLDSPAFPLPNRCRNWILTWNNPPAEGANWIIDRLAPKRYAMQEETGAEGTKHLQGVICLPFTKTFNQMKKMFPSIHWEKCRNIHAAKNYCTKLATRSGKQWTKGFTFPEKSTVQDPLSPFIESNSLYPFQKEVLELVNSPPHDREIHWFYSYVGRTGKSTLCKHLCMKHNAIIVGGSYKDAYYAIATRLKQGNPPSVIVFDLPRCKGAEFLSYTAIEGIKNGCFFSTKYESGMCLMNPPHILVFANVPPVKDQLSEDRWKIHHIRESADYNFADTEDSEDEDG